MKYLSYLQLLILFTACQPSDQAPTFRAPIAADSIDASAVMKGITVSPTLFSDSIRAAVAGKNLRRFMANSELLRIGHFKTVWKDTDLELEWGLDTLEPGPLADLDNYAFKDAHEEVIKQAKAHQLVIIAENHNRPQHRVFTACLLEDLYAIGYRHLGMEALLNLHKDPAGGLVDTAMQKRGYPLTWMLSGTYTNEPEFANLIRAATDLGFQLFAYERNQSSESERDLQMAEHVIAYQKKHPGEKILLHGGWYHAIESDQTKPDGANWMAYHYKTMTGDDPLTVYQDALNEKLADNQRSSPYYQHLIDTRELPAKPQVLVDGSGRLYKGPDGKIPFDIVTFQAPLDTRNGYGEWQSWTCLPCTQTNVSVAQLTANLPAISYPVQLELRRFYEHPAATPVYAAELTGPVSFPDISICQGPYNLTLRTKDKGIKVYPVNI